MTMEEKNIKNINVSQGISQNLILENKEKLTITGAHDVISFDDQLVIIDTDLGMLTIKGENLKVNKLSIDTGDVILEGEIYNLNYSKEHFDNKQSGIIEIGRAHV